MGVCARVCVCVCVYARAPYAQPSSTPHPTRQPQDPEWSREETDALLALCDRLDLRWPVIHDRYPRPGDAAGTQAAAATVAWKARSIEDLQARYYGLRRTLRDARRKQEQEEAAAKGLPPPQPMNITGFDEVGD